MLDKALKYQKAFELFKVQDKKYTLECNKDKGVPSEDDWGYARSLLPFLKIFYDCTNRISG